MCEYLHVCAINNWLFGALEPESQITLSLFLFTPYICVFIVKYESPWRYDFLPVSLS